MYMRSVFAACLLILLLCLAVPASAAEKVFQIKAGSTVNHAAGIYPTLEALRLAIANGDANLDSGSVITLYNNDKTLTGVLPVLPGRTITVKSADGNRYTITAPNSSNSYVDSNGIIAPSAPVVTDGNNTTVRFDNIGIGSSGYAIGAYASYDTGSTLDISNSTFNTGASYDVVMSDGDISVRNSTFSGTGLFSIYSSGTADVNIMFDKNASDITTWTKAVYTMGGLDVNVAEGKVFKLNAGAWADGNTINKTGSGVWKFQGGAANTLNINDGTVHFTETGSSWTGGTINVGKTGVLKLTYNPGNVGEYYKNGAPANMVRTDSITYMTVDAIQSVEGARTEIGNISLHPIVPIVTNDSTSTSTSTFTYGAWVAFVGTGNTSKTTIASTMNIDNNLLTATWKSGTTTDGDVTSTTEAELAKKDAWFIHIEKMNNLVTLDGVGAYADVYRMMNLSDQERDLLDTIYCTGGVGSGLGYLQTLGGYHVQNTLLAMRHNQSNMISKVNQRLTKYQKEELYDLEVTGGEICNYSEWDACPEYSEMWAYIDQTWMSQNDIDDLAGYRYQTHTLGIGYDWHKDNWIYGGVVNYSEGKMKLRNNYGASTDIENLMAAIYASWAQDGWYVSGAGMAGYGCNDSRSTYTLPAFTAASHTGNYGTSMLGASLELGYMFETEFLGEPLRVTPYGDVTFARLHRNAVREKGGENGTVDMNRQFRSANWNMWEGAIGARVSMPIDRGAYMLVPSVDVAVTRTSGEPETGGGDVHFISRDTDGWKIPVMAGNRTSLRMAANLDAKIRENLTIGAGYEFEWRDSYWKHQLNVGMSLGF